MATSGVRVNAVNPGVILTELFTNGGVDNRDIERYLEQCEVLHPLGRAGRPREVAAPLDSLHQVKCRKYKCNQ